MTRRLLTALVLLVTLVGAGCSVFRSVGAKERDRQAIETAVANYLTERSGLNLEAMRWDIVEFNVDRDRAEIRVMFKAKDSDATMHMIYDLERQGEAWAVKRSRPPGLASSPAKGAAAEPGETSLPAGHPPVSEPAKAPKKQ